MRRFIVAISKPSEEDEKGLHEFFKGGQYGWWHWIEGFWLIVDAQDRVSATSLRDQLTKLVPNKNLLVMSGDNPNDWAGWGPPDTSFAGWFKDAWQRNWM